MEAILRRKLGISKPRRPIYQERLPGKPSPSSPSAPAITIGGSMFISPRASQRSGLAKRMTLRQGDLGFFAFDEHW